MKQKIIDRNSQHYYAERQKSLFGIIASQKEKQQRNQKQEYDGGEGITRCQILRLVWILSSQHKQRRHCERDEDNDHKDEVRNDLIEVAECHQQRS